MATVLGIWFGVRAPELSPVTPVQPADQVEIVDDDDDRPPGGGPR